MDMTRKGWMYDQVVGNGKIRRGVGQSVGRSVGDETSFCAFLPTSYGRGNERHREWRKGNGIKATGVDDDVVM
jgi:hypothetical protein